MSCRLSLFMLLVLTVPTLHAAPPTEKINPDDEKALKAAKVATEAPALLEYFQKRTISAKDREKIDGLIRQFSDDTFKVREKASDEVLALGPIALPQLRRALTHSDEEVRERARDVIADLEGKSNPLLSAAVVRVLRVRAPAEAIKTLLDYLPDADNDVVTEEVLTTLALLGVKDNKIDTLLVEALKDKEPARRAAAALVLGRSGTTEQRKSVQALLADPGVHVRFRAAQGLLAGRDRVALPTLIALLTDAPPELATRAEELLSCVASGQSLRQPISENVQQNRNVRTAWEQWWKKNPKIDLTHADVDLPPLNAALRARETARQFAAMALAGEKDKMEKLMELPFTIIGDQSLTNREQAEQYLINMMQNMMNRGVAVNPVVLGTMSFEEYVKSAQPREQAQLTKMRKNDIRAVYISWPQNLGGGRGAIMDGGGESVLLIRVVGDQPQVVGISFNNDRLIRKW